MYMRSQRLHPRQVIGWGISIIIATGFMLLGIEEAIVILFAISPAS